MITIGEVWLIFTSCITIATIIVRLTKTKKDDLWLAKILKYVEPVACLFEKKK